MTELTLMEKLRLAHVTTGQRMFEEAAERIEELEAALKPFADASDIHLGNDDMSIAFGIKIGDLRQASKALGEKP